MGWTGEEGDSLYILGLPSPAPHAEPGTHGFVLQEGYVTSRLARQHSALNLALSPLSPPLPSPDGAVALADLFFKLQG